MAVLAASGAGPVGAGRGPADLASVRPSGDGPGLAYSCAPTAAAGFSRSPRLPLDGHGDRCGRARARPGARGPGLLRELREWSSGLYRSDNWRGPARRARGWRAGPAHWPSDSQVLMQTSVAASFESLFVPLTKSAFGVAIRFTGNRSDAEDLVQEATLLAFRAFDSFEPGTNFKAWFFRILTNCYYSKRRREKSRPVTTDLDDTPDLYLYARSAETGFTTAGPDPTA